MLRLFRHYVSVMLIVVGTVDLAIMLGGVVLARGVGWWLGEGALLPKMLSFAGIMLFALYLADLYDLSLNFGRRELVARLMIALSAGAIVAAAMGFLVPALRFGRLAFVHSITVMAVGLFGWRMLWLRLNSSDRLWKRVLVLGLSPSAEQIVKLQATGSPRFTVLGFLADEPGAHDELPSGSQLLGKTADLLNLVDELRPDLVLVAQRNMRGCFPVDDLLQCRMRGIQVEDWPTFYEKHTGKILVTDVRPSWLIFSDGFVKTRPTRALKRMVDIVLSVAGILLTLPLMGLIVLAIRLDSRGPALFHQERVGQGGRIFVLAKFRSMSVDAERQSGAVWASVYDPRVTRVGRVLRKTRLDELPQLFNVLRKEMSFIGPRPERPEFVQILRQRIPFYIERLSVQPGLSGWAQVRCPYGASVEDALEKLQYDLYYIKNLSPFLDVLILLSTIQVVLFGRGAR